MSHELGHGEGCIICQRVEDGAPVLLGIRDEPNDEHDSGWQFLCGGDHEDGDDPPILSCLDSVIRCEPHLEMFLAQPIGAAIERPSEVHAFERTDVPEPDGEFVCGNCEEVHHGLPMDWHMYRPDYYREDEADQWTLDEDTAVWRSDTDSHFFYRAMLQLPVVNGPKAVHFSVWVTVSGHNFAAVQHLLAHGAEGEITAPFFGWLSNQLPAYPDTLNLKTNVFFVPGAPFPIVELEQSEHPLAIAQHKGIDLARLHEIIAASE